MSDPATITDSYTNLI